MPARKETSTIIYKPDLGHLEALLPSMPLQWGPRIFMVDTQQVLSSYTLMEIVP